MCIKEAKENSLVVISDEEINELTYFIWEGYFEKIPAPAVVESVLKILLLAGFKADDLVHVRYEREKINDDNSYIAEMPVDCPVVVTCKGYIYAEATKWFRYIYSDIRSIKCSVNSSSRYIPGNKELILMVKKYLSVNIQINSIGELLEAPVKVPDAELMVEYYSNDDELIDPVGLHVLCGGNIRRIQVSQSHDALFCSECGLRICIPNEIKTYGELQEYLKEKIDSEKYNELLLKYVAKLFLHGDVRTSEELEKHIDKFGE